MVSGTWLRWLGAAVVAAAIVVALFATGTLHLPGGGKAASAVNIIEWVNPPAVSATRAVDQGFTKAADVTVHLTTASGRATNYAALEKTSVEAGSQDIMAVFPIQPYPHGMPEADLSSEQLWGVKGVYADLSGQPWAKNLLSASRAAQTYNGKLYGLNTGVYQIGIFYNKAVFAKHHLTPPTTYSAFLALCRTLKADGVQPLYYATAGGADGYDWVMVMDSQLMALWRGNVDQQFWSGHGSFTDPRFIQALDQARTILRYAEPNWQGQNWTGMPGAFASGKAAMLLDGSWDMASVLAANPTMQIGYFPLPGSNTASQNQSILQPDLTWTVLKNAKNKANALKWLDYFARPAVYAKYVKATGISPSFQGSFPSATRGILGSYLSKGLLEANAEPALPNAGPFGLQPSNFYATLQNVLDGQRPVRSTAAQWEAQWRQMLASK